MTPYVIALDLPEPVLGRALQLEMDTALELECQIIVIGAKLDGEVLICTCGCAIKAPGAAVLIPDLLVLEYMAEGGEPTSEVLTRADGRSVLVYKTRRWR